MITETGRYLTEQIADKLMNDLGCPLCSLITDFEFKQIAQLQYQITYDDKLREILSDNGGFCDFHFRQFKKIANGKTNIIFLKSIIEARAYKRNNFSIDCHICEKVQLYETELIDAFIKLLSGESSRKFFEKKNGICFPHFRIITEKPETNSIKEWLGRVHIMQIERMQEDFNRMSSFKSFYEIDHEKRRLIYVLIEKLAGRKAGAL